MVHFNAALLLYRHKNLDDSRLQIVISKASLRVSYKKIIPKLLYYKLTSFRLNYIPPS